MSILKYTSYERPFRTGAFGVLQKIAGFAQAQGWTIDYHVDVTWDGSGGNGWVAHPTPGAGVDFLQITSSGYGSNTIRHRLKAEHYDVDNDRLYGKVVDPTANDYDDSVFLDPMNLTQDCRVPTDNETYCFVTLPPDQQIEKLYLAGDDKFIFVSINVYGSAYFSFAMGLPDVVKEWRNEDIAFWLGPVWFTAQDWDVAWASKYGAMQYPIFPYGDNSPIIYSAYWGSTRYGNSASTYFRTDANYTSPNTDAKATTTSYWAPITDMLTEIPHCGGRYLHKPNWFFLHPTDLVWYHLATMPIYVCHGGGLLPGELLYDSGKYFRCVPFFDIGPCNVWAAIEIDPNQLTTTTSTTTTTTTTTTI